MILFAVERYLSVFAHGIIPLAIIITWKPKIVQIGLDVA